MDQANCLTLTKTRFSIDASASYLMVRGLSYPVTITLEQPAHGLKLIPYSKYLIFNPTQVNFTNFLSSTASLNIIVPSDLPVGEYIIRWIKHESSSPDKYLEVPDTLVSVVPNTVLAPLAYLSVEPFNYVWTGSLARDVMVTLSQDPATELIVKITTRVNDPRVQVSLDNIIFKSFPITLTFVRGETKKRFYIWAEVGASSNYLQFSLDGENKDVFNTNIPDVPYMIMSPPGGAATIVNTQILSTGENSAIARVSLSSLGTIFWVAVIDSPLMNPTQLELMSHKLEIDSKWYVSGTATVERLGDGNSYSVTFNISGLYAQTAYKLVCIARSTSGQYSNNSNVTFSTIRVSPGASIRVPTSSSVSPDILTNALSNLLSVPTSRIIYQSSQVFTDNSQTMITGTTYNTYTFVLAPHPTKNSPSALQTAYSLTRTNVLQNVKLAIPQYYANVGLKVSPVTHIPPRILSAPEITTLSYYTLSFKMMLIEQGKVYVLVMKKGLLGDTRPSSFQIAHGLLPDNTYANSRYWIGASTSENGYVSITFDELNDNTEYNLYITAANNIPYEPADLLVDSKIINFNFKTLKNPNLGERKKSSSWF